MQWHFAENIPAALSCGLGEIGQFGVINIAKSSFSKATTALDDHWT